MLSLHVITHNVKIGNCLLTHQLLLGSYHHKTAPQTERLYAYTDYLENVLQQFLLEMSV